MRMQLPVSLTTDMSHYIAKENLPMCLTYWTGHLGHLAVGTPASCFRLRSDQTVILRPSTNVFSAFASRRQNMHRCKLECGPIPNVMAALPNVGGALCSTPQSLADAH